MKFLLIALFPYALQAQTFEQMEALERDFVSHERSKKNLQSERSQGLLEHLKKKEREKDQRKEAWEEMMRQKKQRSIASNEELIDEAMREALRQEREVERKNHLRKKAQIEKDKAALATKYDSAERRRRENKPWR